MTPGQIIFLSGLLLAYALVGRSIFRSHQRQEQAERERRRNHKRTLISRREWP